MGGYNSINLNKGKIKLIGNVKHRKIKNNWHRWINLYFKYLWEMDRDSNSDHEGKTPSP